MASSAPTLMPLARLARGALSGSVTRAWQASGTHLHRILGYSHVQGSVPTGDYIMSTPFVVGDREWEFRIYPNGVDEEHRRFISAALLPALGEQETMAMATYRVSVLDDGGSPVHSRVVGPCRLGRYGKRADISDLVATEELQRSAPYLLKNDCLDIQCEVAMVKMETKRRNRWWFM